MDSAIEIEKTTNQFNSFFEKAVKKTLEEQSSFYQDPNMLDQEVYESIIKYSSGGKRIRPFIVKTFSQKDFDNQDLLNACLAFEMFHLAALIHDDIIDNASLRRNAETIHVYFDKYSENKKSLGQDIAILLGDVFLIESLRYASLLKNDSKNDFFQMTMRTIRGQHIDVLGANNEYGQVAKELVNARHELKTAWYTFVSPMMLGLQISGKDLTKEMLENLKQCSLELGLLYQIRDDIIDCIDEKSGKKLFGDIFENQTTWVTLYMMEKHPHEFEQIKQISKQTKNPENIESLKNIFKDIDLTSPYNKLKDELYNKIKDLPEDTSIEKAYLLSILELLKI
jgi:geranylgeranyl pyrophosphate synthase